ncbi:hypothetical protein GYMLUDRAFT_170302 [Collybiopsis luxurians FD-317 M1]|uniref:BTB domain-containing protein n=1 Tax=Collybiopsis luxurians FD-317 M1 TaxID=944289 RepID=A0A0D0CTD8_9AGAR|nr:hypothetical protein GYMLUDRAFT_170302 [Collybiopsis luxurians FD-317 M1]
MDESPVAPPLTNAEDLISQSRTVKKSPTFYFDSVIFQVEDILYSLPRARLMEESEVFEDMFALPQGVGKLSEGASDDNPIHLEQTKKTDWECLLKLLFQRNFQPGESGPNFTLDEWESILTLATRWEMSNIRACAIERIALFNEPAKKISLARRYRIPRFFIPSLVQLIGRSEPLSVKEFADLGVECALKIVSMRERCFDSSHSYEAFRPQKIALDVSSPTSSQWSSVVNEIHKTFTDHDEYYK